MSAQETTRAASTTPAEGNAPPPASGSVPRLAPAPVVSGLLRGLHRRCLFALILGLLGAAAVGGALWAFLPTRYHAEVWLQVNRPPHEGLAPAVAETDLAAYLRTQAALLKSPLVLTTALARPEVAELPGVQKEGEPVAWLDRITTVESAPDQALLRIGVTSHRPGEAAVLADAIAQAYLHELREQRQAYLRQVREASRRAAETLRQTQARVQRSNDPRLAHAERELLQTQSDVRSLRTEIEALRGRKKQIDTLSAPSAAVAERLEKDPAAAAARKQIAQVEDLMRRVERVSALGDKDPLFKKSAAQRDALREQLAHRRKELTADVKRELRARALADLDDQIARRQTQLAAASEHEKNLAAEVKRRQAERESSADLATLRKAAADQQEALRKLEAEVQAIEAEGPGPAWVKSLGQAPQPRATNRASRLRLTWLGAGGAFLLFALMASWQEFRTRRVTASADVSHALGLPVIGVLPPPPARSAGDEAALTGAAGSWEGPMAEAVDALRTVLLRTAGNSARVILVTSAVPGEGKTSLASRLALSLARSWRKTLLLDADLRKPTAHRQYGLALEPGLSELLRGEVEAGDVIQPTPAGRLWMMPAGHWDSHALQALAQEGSAGLFRSLVDQYDFVVVDGPAVLPAADALLFSQYADAILLAVRCGTSRLPTVHAARQRLATLNAPVLGAVVVGATGEFTPVTTPSPGGNG